MDKDRYSEFSLSCSISSNSSQHYWPLQEPPFQPPPMKHCTPFLAGRLVFDLQTDDQRC